MTVGAVSQRWRDVMGRGLWSLIILILWAPGLALAFESATPLLSDDQGLVVSAADLEVALRPLQPAERAALIGDGAQARALVRRIYTDKRMLAEVEQRGLDRDPRVQARLYLARRDVLLKALRDDVVARLPAPDVTSLAQERYAARQGDFVIPAAYRVAEILLKVECESERAARLALAESLVARLAAGEDFGTLARDYSQGPGTGEDVKWESADQLPAPIATALAELGDGAVSGVVASPRGYHLLRRLEYRPARQKSFEEVRAELERVIKETYIQHGLAEAQQGFRPGADARMDEAAVLAVLAELAELPD